MLIRREESLRDFEFWSGAISTVHILTEDELDMIEEVLEELYPEGINETELNDIFWFDDDFIAQTLGYEDGTELWTDRNR